jgi:hypothetical protein
LRRRHFLAWTETAEWDGSANDNQAWPLLAQLRKDGNGALVPVVTRYRQLWQCAYANPLEGTDPERSIFNVVQRSADKSDPDDRKKGTLLTSHSAGQDNGSKAIRETSDLADHRRKNGTPNPTRPGTARIREWHGEDMIASTIDAKRDILRLRAVLGVGREPFEESVCYGSTLTEIGASRDIGQHASGAGKMIVMLGIEAVQNEFRLMDRERRAA